MANVAFALTTKEKVKNQLSVSVTTHDEFIDNQIDSVSQWIENECGGRRFLRTTYTNKILDSKGGNKLFLPHYPISTLTTLEYRGGSWSSPTWTAFNANSYLLYGDSGYIHFSTDLLKSPQYFRITYIAGYLIDFGDELDTTKHTLPFDISQLATELVSKRYSRRFVQGVKRESVEGQSVEWKDEMDENHKATLARYKNAYIT